MSSNNRFSLVAHWKQHIYESGFTGIQKLQVKDWSAFHGCNIAQNKTMMLKSRKDGPTLKKSGMDVNKHGTLTGTFTGGDKQGFRGR